MHQYFPLFCLIIVIGAHILTTNLTSRDNINEVLPIKRRNEACDGTGVKICALRIMNNVTEYKDFDNDCYMFLSNVFDNPRHEFYMATEGQCIDFLKTRRDVDIADFKVYGKNHKLLPLRPIKLVLKTTPSILRAGSDEKEKRKRTHDGHFCPVSCPDIYKPTCMNVNRGNGTYFKLLHFVNHCEADLYYCNNKDVLNADGPAEIVDSGLTLSLCTTDRYLDQSRFYEIASSLSVYGWLLNESAGRGTIFDKTVGTENKEVIERN